MEKLINDLVTFSKAFKKLMGVAPSFYTPDNSHTADTLPQA